MHRNLVNAMVQIWMMIVLVCCATKRDSSQDRQQPESVDISEWKEMDDFHILMAETFHPYRDSANLEPLKLRASELMIAAERWASAPLPAKVNNREMKERLQQLSSGAATLAESVKSADDNVIGEQLTRLHDTFHAIEDGWYTK